MREMKGKLSILLFGLVGLVNTSHASLSDLGNGLVSDDTLNITWLQDANVFKTLCDASDPIATGFTPVDAPNAATICTTDDGAMTWNDAEAWIVRLNAQVYLGRNDWRQPATQQPDLTCEATAAPGNNNGYNCIGSELGNLYNASLGNPNTGGTGTGLDGSTGTVGSACSGPPPSCFVNSAPFVNTSNNTYWSGTTFAPNTTRAWTFATTNGFQGNGNKTPVTPTINVWPVFSGAAITAAPMVSQAIPTLSAWGLGIMSLLLVCVGRRKIQ